MKYPTFIARYRSMGSRFSTERPARKTRRRFSCCTDFPLHRECSSRSSPGFPIAIIWSRPITLASDTATGRIRKIRVHLRSLRRDHESFHRSARALALHALHAGLRRPRRFSHGVGASGSDSRLSSFRMPWRTTKAWGELEDAARLLGRSRSNESALRTNLLSLAATRTRHVGNDPNVERYDPDLWTDEFRFLNQPGQARFKATCSTTIEPTSTPTRSGKHGCARSSRACW
jgi:hypothetical protein